MNHEAIAAIALVLLTPSVVFAGAPRPRAIGDTETLGAIPTPGFPEGIVVRGRNAYIAGPATFGTAGGGPSQVLELDTRSGVVTRTYDIRGESLGQEHALSCITDGGDGRLYAISTQLGIVRLDPRTGRQDIYASPLPILAACPSARDACAGGRCQTSSTPCAPVDVVRGALPNDLAFDDDGNLYVTDSFQATIFRIPAGGGSPVPWFQDERLDTSMLPGFTLGPNGVRVSPDGFRLFFTVSSGGHAGVWTLPLVDDPGPEELARFHPYPESAMADGIAFGIDGRLFVALAGKNQIDILGPHGRELFAFPTAERNAKLSVPFSNPANIAFDGRGSILVTNHSLMAPDPKNFVVLDAFVADFASPLAQPFAGRAPGGEHP